MKYVAFISYRHNELSRPHAESLEAALKQYAKPLWKPPIAIFRDERVLRAGDDLPAEIRKALSNSGHLLYLASAAAAESEWVEEELRIWCDDLGRARQLQIVLVADRITADPRTKKIIWEETDALPAVLRPHIDSIPVWTDLSWAATSEQRDLGNVEYRRAINRLVATFRGVDPGDMNDEQVLTHRRNLRLRNAGIAAVLAFAVAAGFFWNQARLDRVAAENSRDLATVGELSANSEVLRLESANQLDALRSSLLTAAETVRRRHVTQTDLQLRRVLTAVPDEVWSRSGIGDVQKLAVDDAGGVLLAATLTGLYAFDVRSGQSLWARPSGPLGGFVFGRNTRLVTSLVDGALLVFRTADGSEVWRKQIGTAVTSIAFSPDGGKLAVGETGCCVRLFDAATGRLIWETNPSPGSLPHPIGLLFNPRADSLLVGTGETIEGETIELAVADGTVQRQMPQAFSWGAFLRNGEALMLDRLSLTLVRRNDFWGISGANDRWEIARREGNGALGTPALDQAERFVALPVSGEVRLLTLDLTGGRNLWRVPIDGGANSVALLGDAYLAVGNAASLRVVRLPAGSQFDGHPIPAASYLGPRPVAVDQNTTKAAVYDFADGLRVLDLTTGSELWRTAKGGMLAFSPDGRCLAVADRDTEDVACYDATTGTRTRLLGKATPARLTFSPHGRWLALDNSLLDLSRPNAAPVPLQDFSEFDLSHLAFDAAERRAAVSQHGDVRIYDLSTSTTRVSSFKNPCDADPSGSANYSPPVAFAPDGDRLVMICDGVRLLTLDGHEIWHRREQVGEALAVGGGGPFVAAASGNRVFLIDLKTGLDFTRIDLVRIAPESPQESFVTGLAFSPDGRFLQVITLDSVQRHALNAADLVAEACARMAAASIPRSVTVVGEVITTGITCRNDPDAGRTVKNDAPAPVKTADIYSKDPRVGLWHHMRGSERLPSYVGVGVVDGELAAKDCTSVENCASTPFNPKFFSDSSGATVTRTLRIAPDDTLDYVLDAATSSYGAHETAKYERVK
jgi:WD40 repeat protein